MEAKPSLSVGEVLCETAEQVQAVSRQDGHKSSQVWLKEHTSKSFFRSFCTLKDTNNRIIVTRWNRAVALIEGLIPVKLMVLITFLFCVAWRFSLAACPVSLSMLLVSVSS